MQDSKSKVEIKPSRRAMIVMVCVALAVIMMSIFSRIENWKRDFTVNHAKLDSQSSDPLLQPLVLSRSPEEVVEVIEQWVQQHRKWSVESRETIEGGIKIHLTRTTAVLHFTDDVHVRLMEHGEGTRVDAESRSRVGKGDLGQNPRNLRELVSGLRGGR